MAALPYLYFVVGPEEQDLFTGLGLEDGKKYTMHNRSPFYPIAFDEREPGTDPRDGMTLDPGTRITYDANEDSPMFVWVPFKNRTCVLVLSERRT